MNRPDFASNFNPGPGKPFPGCGDVLEMPDFMSATDPGPGKPLPESGASLEVPDFASDSDPGSCYVPVFRHLDLGCFRVATSVDLGNGRCLSLDDPRVRCPSTPALLAVPCDFGETLRTQLVGSDDIILRVT